MLRMSNSPTSRPVLIPCRARRPTSRSKYRPPLLARAPGTSWQEGARKSRVGRLLIRDQGLMVERPGNLHVRPDVSPHEIARPGPPRRGTRFRQWSSTIHRGQDTDMGASHPNVKSSENLRVLAEKYRALAKTLHDKSARDRMLNIAENYDRQAVRVMRRDRTNARRK
jgi:hypothetical protein